MNEAISEKAVTVAENMEKVFAAGARSGGSVGGELPTVGKEGDVLTVVAGKWESKSLPTGGTLSVPTIDLAIEDQEGNTTTYKVYGYTENEYYATPQLPTLPVFDLEIEKLNGGVVKYKVFGYEVGNGVT